MVTHLPLVPKAQSRMWSMAALAADAADDTATRSNDGRAALAHGGQEGVGVPFLVVDHVLATLSPLMVAKR